MYTEKTKGDWNEIKSKIKTRFGKLTDESIESVKGNLELLAAKLQTAYGYAREQADRELTSFKASLHTPTDPEKKLSTEAEKQPPQDERKASSVKASQKVA